MSDYVSIYDAACDYVYERVFVRFPDFNRVTRGVAQGLAQAMAMRADTSEVTVKTALGPRTYRTPRNMREVEQSEERDDAQCVHFSWRRRAHRGARGRRHCVPNDDIGLVRKLFECRKHKNGVIFAQLRTRFLPSGSPYKASWRA